MSSNAKVRHLQGAAEEVVDSGGQITVKSGGKIHAESGGDVELASGATVDVQSGADIAVADGGRITFDGYAPVVDLAMVAAQGGTNVAEVTITAKDGAGNTVAEPVSFDLWLSDAATGAGLTGTTASGTVTAKSASGAVIGTYTAKKALRVQTKADGTFVLEITNSANTAFKVAAQAPGTGRTIVGVTLAAGDYGS